MNKFLIALVLGLCNLSYAAKETNNAELAKLLGQEKRAVVVSYYTNRSPELAAYLKQRDAVEAKYGKRVAFYAVDVDKDAELKDKETTKAFTSIITYFIKDGNLYGQTQGAAPSEKVFDEMIQYILEN